MAELLLIGTLGGGYKFIGLPELDRDGISNKAVTIIERASEGSGYLDSSFTMYYFRNKKILCNTYTVDLVDKYLKDTYFEYLSFITYKYTNLIVPLAVLGLGIVYYSVTCHTILSNDSCMKVNHGLVLAVDNKPELRFTRMVMYGLIEPLINSFGFMSDGDYIYSIYPVFFLIGLGLICGGLYEILLLGNHVVDAFKYRFCFLLTFSFAGFIDNKYRY